MGIIEGMYFIKLPWLGAVYSETQALYSMIHQNQNLVYTRLILRHQGGGADSER